MVACGVDEPDVPPADIEFTPASFADLPGWGQDELAGVLPAWQRSCERLVSMPPETPLGPTGLAGSARDWQVICARVLAAPADNGALRGLIENELRPYQVAGNGQAEGLFTGYYEPIFTGSRTRSAQFNVPLHAVPPDLIEISLGDFDPTLTGRRFVGHVVDGTLQPYHRRGDIQNGAIDSKNAELLWMADPLEAFILHIQGSGIIHTPEGETIRVGYADHNGFDYVSVGKWLIAEGELPPDQADFDDIRAWLDKNPNRAADVLAINDRYIFFRELPGDGPIGAGGEVLTPERSLAVDTNLLPLGVPIWLDAEHPDPTRDPPQRLMMAQDSGNAIRGAVRGDFYWGTGGAALALAGRMKSKGQYYVLLPRSLDLTKVAAR